MTFELSIYIFLQLQYCVCCLKAKLLFSSTKNAKVSNYSSYWLDIRHYWFCDLEIKDNWNNSNFENFLEYLMAKQEEINKTTLANILSNQTSQFYTIR